METYIDALPAARREVLLDNMRHRNFTSGGRNFLDDYAGGDERYAAWLILCEISCSRKIGLGIFDLSDWTWADAYADGLSPTAAVLGALASDDTYAALFGAE